MEDDKIMEKLSVDQPELYKAIQDAIQHYNRNVQPVMDELCLILYGCTAAELTLEKIEPKGAEDGGES